MASSYLTSLLRANTVSCGWRGQPGRCLSRSLHGPGRRDPWAHREGPACRAGPIGLGPDPAPVACLTEEDYYEDEEDEDPDALKDPLYQIDLQVRVPPVGCRLTPNSCPACAVGRGRASPRASYQGHGLVGSLQPSPGPRGSWAGCPVSGWALDWECSGCWHSWGPSTVGVPMALCDAPPHPQAYLTDFLCQFAQQPCYAVFSGHLSDSERRVLQAIGI